MTMSALSENCMLRMVLLKRKVRLPYMHISIFGDTLIIRYLRSGCMMTMCEKSLHDPLMIL